MKTEMAYFFRCCYLVNTRSRSVSMVERSSEYSVRLYYIVNARLRNMSIGERIKALGIVSGYYIACEYTATKYVYG